MDDGVELIIFEVNQQVIAEPDTKEMVIDEPQDALDLMASASYQGASSVILYETNLNPAFFDLRSGLAGEVMLKFTNYRMKLAVIGEFEKYRSKSLQAFIGESNRGNQFFFVPDREAAIQKLRKSTTTG
jgi:hypothetical protein